MAQEKFRRSAGRWRLGFVAVLLLSIALLIAVVVLAVKLDSVTTVVPPCGGSSQAVVDVSEATEPGPHHDLTERELKEVEEHLYRQSDLNLAARGDLNVSKAELYLAELLPPPKAEVLEFYSGRAPQPPRQARVIISRGDKTPPVVEEYVVTLTGTDAPKHELLSSSVRKNPVPFDYRPLTTSEFIAIGFYLPEVDRVLGTILQESYGAKFTECKQCLTYYPIPLTSAIEGVMTRKYWLRVMQNAEYRTLHPVDMALLADVHGSDPRQFAITKVFYAGTVYPSMEALANAYNLVQTNKTRVPFPTQDENLYSLMRRRGDPVPRKPMRAPHLVEPDGKRYNIRHRHLEYMQWEADFQLSALNGPQLYNVKFRGERIAYQVGLQEIAVFYSGFNGANRLADFLDSGDMLGIHSRGLIPGADCPLTSTYISVSFLKEYSRPHRSKRAFCVFEQNTGIPLRRHSSYRLDQGSFYAGMLDSALVLRSIITVGNYDYVIDFVFHQSGALQVRALSSGYIISSFYKGSDSPYGWRIQDHILGNLHHHLFNFKVDLDILGTTNRYETLDISSEKVSNGDFTDNSNPDYWQTRFDRSVKRTEKEALYDFNFDHPKYHIVYKEGGNTREGTPRGYRIKMDGSSKLLLPPNLGNEPSVSWARHQLVVTRYKPEESTSSTPYAMFDSFDPTINFTKFYEDDEPILDEDLVFWLSLGVHHIPHTEDLPVTPTPGFSLDFTLLPYNYFPECPSMQSRDAIRLEFRDKERPDQGVRVVREGHAAQAQCVTQTGSLEDDLANDPDLGLQTSY